MKRIGYIFNLQYIISIAMIMIAIGCCHMPLVDCFKIPLSVDTPRVITDSIFNENQYLINADLLERRRKKEYTLMITISHDNNKIHSFEKRNFYLSDGEKIYSDKVVSFDPVNQIYDNDVNIHCHIFG